MSDVFISYSRSDSNFVCQLHTALEKHQRDVWVDWQDIPLSSNDGYPSPPRIIPVWTPIATPTVSTTPAADSASPTPTP